MGYDRFEVTEANAQFGFARVRSRTSGETFHSELFPQGEGGGGATRLQVGDEVEGLRRGQSVSRLSWVKKAAPPLAVQARASELLRLLGEHGVETAWTSEALGEALWRSREDPVPELLRAHLPHLFDHQVHPFEDPALLERLEGAMRKHLPDFEVRPLKGRSVLAVNGREVPLAEGDRDPLHVFRPLVEHLNDLLAHEDVRARWFPTEDNVVLAPPELLAALGEKGALPGAPRAQA